VPRRSGESTRALPSFAPSGTQCRRTPVQPYARRNWRIVGPGCCSSGRLCRMLFKAQRDGVGAARSRTQNAFGSGWPRPTEGAIGESEALRRYRRFFQTHDLRGVPRRVERDEHTWLSRT
jgi:hypothetical protein